MSVETDIEDLLSASEAVRTLVSGPHGFRIRPFMNEEGGDWPAITYTITDTTDVTDSSSAGGLNFSTVQIDCWAASYAVCSALQRAARAAMLDRAVVDVVGNLSSVAPASGQRDLHEPPTGGSGRPTYRKSMDFTAAYEETEIR